MGAGGDGIERRRGGGNGCNDVLRIVRIGAGEDVDGGYRLQLVDVHIFGSVGFECETKGKTGIGEEKFVGTLARSLIFTRVCSCD